VCSVPTPRTGSRLLRYAFKFTRLNQRLLEGEGGRVDRREAIIGLAACVAGAWLRPGIAQRTYRVAVLIHGTERTLGKRLAALRAGLKEHGYVEGRNLGLSVRWNEGGLERLPDLAAELLREKPDVLVAGPVLSAAAAQKHTRDVPICRHVG